MQFWKIPFAGLHFREVACWMRVLGLPLLRCAGLLGLHFTCFHGGYFGYDELEYTRLAADWWHWRYEHDLNLYAYRWAVVVPLAMWYGLLGINDFSNFVSSTSVLFIVFLPLANLIRSYPFGAFFCALLYVAVMPHHLMYIEKPMPDIPVELGFLLMITGWAASPDRPRPWLAAGMFVLGVVLCFLAKETFLIFYLVFVVLLIVDLSKGRASWFWAVVLGSLLVFSALYFGGFYVLQGDALARVRAIFHERFVGA
ncbi:MAG: hypothetical protein NZM43_00345 [Saprospiraceae bacterium]|nr:hypothetical protein [Saprospiraceae bacterium]MDW8482750.1 hypothetical protein [Saprospiraceae bacterium]